MQTRFSDGTRGQRRKVKTCTQESVKPHGTLLPFSTTVPDDSIGPAMGRAQTSRRFHPVTPDKKSIVKTVSVRYSALFIKTNTSIVTRSAPFIFRPAGRGSLE